MYEQVEVCFRAMRFTPILGVLDLLLIFHFCVSWFLSIKKTGWKVDFWYITLFFSAFQSILILYPFNASIYNVKTTLGQIGQIAPFVDTAFLISVLGYLFVWVGRFTYDHARNRVPLAAILQLARPLSRLIEGNIKNKKGVLCLTLGAILFGVVIFGIQLINGELFNGRRFFLKTPEFRPFFNVAISLFSIAFTFSVLRFVQYRERYSMLVIIALSCLSLFSGVRSLFIGGIIWIFLFQAFLENGKVSFKKMSLLFFALFLIAVFLTNIRDGNYGFVSSIVSCFFYFFYGNNFSDTRDFAWILSCWDNEYLYGKSYIAALISFIPRSFSTFRETWGISMYTNDLTNFSSDDMPGLRPGLFGEAYFNFGLLGVILFGWIFGFCLRYADVKIKEYVRASKDLIKGYSHVIAFSLVSHLAVTAGIWTFYIFLLVNLALLPLRKGETHTSST
jgi:oligosaccharide repeat unit polymerase